MEHKAVPIGANITHYAQLKNSEYLGHWDLEEGKDTNVIIDSLAFEEVFNQKTSRKEIKPVAAFRGAKKRLILNATAMKAVSSWHGSNPQKWPGKGITLFRTTTKLAGEMVECIRIRPNSGKAVKDASDKAADAAK